jgi:hypothetical protein
MAKKKIVLSAIVVVAMLAAGAAFFLFGMGGPDPAQFEYLKEPQIHVMEDQKVLEVEARGDPTVAGSEAFGLLFKTYFKLKGVPKGPRQPAPRARWPLSFDTPKTEWIGRYAMPLPEGIDSPPSQGANESGLRAEITTWTYGEVAEILHVGPYEREESTIQRLMQFIKDRGYRIAGEHEEEYIKGPSVFSKGDPEKYLTIIRYRVKKAK